MIENLVMNIFLKIKKNNRIAERPIFVILSDYTAGSCRFIKNQ